MKRRLCLFFLIIVLLLPSFSLVAMAESGTNTQVKDMSGKKIAVLTGSIMDVVAQKHFPECTLYYVNANADLGLALESGKADGYVVDEPYARLFIRQYPGHKITQMLDEDSYGYIFTKGAEKSETLVAQMNAFLKKCREDGTLQHMDDVWFGIDESVQKVDFDSLTGENGTLNLSVSTDSGAPFVYVKDGQFAGFDIDIAVRFCKEYGYGVTIHNGTFASILTDVSSGKADFGTGCISITEERKKSMLFSEPNYVGGTVLVEKAAASPNEIKSLSDLSGKPVGVLTGSVTDVMLLKEVPDANVQYFQNAADLSVALETGKVVAYITDEPIARSMMSLYPSHKLLGIMTKDNYAVAYPKNNERSAKIMEDFNAFLVTAKADGTMEELQNIWFGSDESKKTVDFASLTGENGTVHCGISTSIGAPITYLKDGKFAGFDVDMVFRFCKAYGYGLEITDSDVSSFLAGIASGKCDFATGCIIVTEERKEAMAFSDVYYEGGLAVVIKESASRNGVTAPEATSFFASLRESFEKTFVREGRWKLFVSGVLTTLLITVLSALFGTIIGFVIFFFYRYNHRVFNAIINVYMMIFQYTPVVVLLMVLYYVIFGKVNVSAMWVSVLGFSLLFAAGVIELLKVGVNAVDRGQTEAALALGYTEPQAFFRMVLPQAAKHFLPGYRSELVTLIKGTAIVGYITVQDLTKVGDIVRSRTYEAFFPLIVTAVIYFLLALGLTAIVKRVEFRAAPGHRDVTRFLKGVKTK